MVDFDDETPAAETAEYIHGMAKELEALAARARLGFLAYLLSMVEQEAQRAADAGGPVTRSM